MIWPTSAGVRRSPLAWPYVTFYALSDYGGLMGAAGCRKSANFGGGSNPLDPRQPQISKKLHKKK